MYARVGGLLALVAVVTAGRAWADATTERVSVGPGGQQADSASGTSNPGRTCCEIMGAAISGDGRFVAFESSANNLVRRDANGNEVDVFVRDRKLGLIELISLGTGGPQGDTFSGYPAISRDGRFVAFYSEADNLVPNDTNRIRDIFVRDRKLGTTEIASLAPGGALAKGFFGSSEPAISGDGRYVAFWSDATNLVPHDTNGLTDVFVHDRVTGKNDCVSVGPGGVQANDDSYSGGPPAPSTDGRVAAFASAASNLVEGDTNGVYDVFVRDRKRGRTERVSVGQRGVQGDGSSFYPAISADGRYVAFVSLAANLVPGDTNGSLDIFVRDRQLGTTERVSVGPDGAQACGQSGHSGVSISAHGRYVAFESRAANLAPGDSNGRADVFVRDRQLDTTERVSVGQGGAEADGPSAFGQVPAISADGRSVAFQSYATDLVARDTNGQADIFVHDH